MPSPIGALARLLQDIFAPPHGSEWCLFEANYEPALEHDMESRFAIANGFIGIRGSLDIPTAASRPLTYVAGRFAAVLEPPGVQAIVPAPPAFVLRVSLGDEQLAIDLGVIREHTRTLDFRRGLLLSAWQQELPSGRLVRLDSVRFASETIRNIAVQIVRFHLDEPGRFSLESLEEMRTEPPDESEPGLLSNNELALAHMQQSLLEVDGKRNSRWSVGPSSEPVIIAGQDVALVQVSAYGLEPGLEEATSNAREAMETAKRTGLETIYDRHVRRWQERWKASDVVIEGDRQAQAAMRFAVFHLISSADPELARASIGARGLTGNGYMGHVFWDTEIFMLPFYTFTWPEAARSLLMYRYLTLPKAREKARSFGYVGASYAWESAATGQEMTPPYARGPQNQVIAIRNGEMENHISADVAYAVWQYWLATRDVSFLLDAGAEILLETSRFWASRCQLGDDGRYHIRHVIGPDEYHEDVDDNAYTNYMAKWNIERGLVVATLLQKRWPGRWRKLADELGLSDEELARWQGIAAGIVVLCAAESGVLEQFADYFGLEKIDLSEFPGRTVPIDVLLGAKRTNASQVTKQADVLMLLALFPQAFSAEVTARNFKYYEPRCGHGSSLSPPVHALVAARMGLTELAERYFRETATIDLGDSMGNTSAGLHMGSLGGLWEAAVFGFGGMSLDESGLAFTPHIPATWQTLRFPIQYRKRHLSVEISNERRTIELRLGRGRPISVRIYGRSYRLVKGQTVSVLLNTDEGE